MLCHKCLVSIIRKILTGLCLSMHCWTEMVLNLGQYSTHLYHNTHTHTRPFYCCLGFCPGLPVWAGTRNVKRRRKNQSGFTGARDNEWQWHQHNNNSFNNLLTTCFTFKFLTLVLLLHIMLRSCSVMQNDIECNCTTAGEAASGLQQSSCFLQQLYGSVAKSQLILSSLPCCHHCWQPLSTCHW